MELKIHPDDKNKKEQVALLSFLMVNLKLRERLIGRPHEWPAVDKNSGYSKIELGVCSGNNYQQD